MHRDQLGRGASRSMQVGHRRFKATQP